MRKRSFWLVLFVGIIGISLGGCASMNARMQEYCGFKKVVEEAPPPAVVRQEPQRPPAVVQPAPPIKKDRN